MKKCITCSAEFIVKRNENQKACSRSCNATFHNKEMRKNWQPPKCKHCGQEVKRRSSKTIFCSQKCMGIYHRGDKNTQWKGGKKKHSEGYVYLFSPTHIGADKMGYILEHRILMENEIGRLLTKDEVVHHINEKKNDNRITNLLLLRNQSEHIALHNYLRKLKTRCPL